MLSSTQSREVVGTEGGGGSTATRTTARRAAAGSAAGSATVATRSTTVATGGAAARSATTITTITATATATAATSRTVLARAGVVLPCDGLLDLLVLQLLGLASRGGEVVLLAGLLQGSALRLVLDLADLERLIQGERSSALGEVSIEGDLLDLGLLGLSLSLLGVALSLLGLGDGLAGLLVFQLGIAIGSTPRLGSLLLGTAVRNVLGW